MKSTRIVLLTCFTATALLSGCVTAPPREGAAVSAYSVGDRGRVTFEEVVVSLRLSGANAPYQNLHVALAAFVNPLKPTLSSPYDAEGILRRMETRVIARVSESLSDLGEQSLNTRELRKRILGEGQSVINDALRQWEHSSDYRVELVIASLYWTDASVGRLQQQKTGWW
jgi:hypothetical protein